MWRKILIIALASAWIAACDDDDDVIDENLTLDISGLQNLGSDYQYEGWIIVGGAPMSTGTFTVGDNGELSKKNFNVDVNDLDQAEALIVTIEPNPDSDPAPSNTKMLAGDFSGNTAMLSISHQIAIGADFSSADGVYLLATPTTETTEDETSGVWFIDNTGGSMAAGLNLPGLPDGWQYEGWAVTGGTPVTTGKFSSVTGADASAPFSGTVEGPPFPGEDFVQNAPSGLTFPTDLSGSDIVVTIEPNPDNSENPFSLKPLVGTVPDSAATMMIYPLEMSDESFPTGSATRN